MSAEKVCSSCGEVRPIDQFWRDARKPDGRDYVCAVCRSLRRSQRRGRTAPHKDSPWLKAILPQLAARLCAQLHGETAPPLSAAYIDVELISMDTWNQVMRLVCDGAHPRDAIRQVGIRPGVFVAHLRYEPRLKAWLARAKQASKRRHQPSVLEMDAVLRELLHNPGMSARTVCLRHGVDYAGFIARSKTPEWEDRYLRAKGLQIDRSFEGMRTAVASLGDGLTRAARSDMARQAHALKRLAPRRLRSGKPLDAATAALRDARGRATRRHP